MDRPPPGRVARRALALPVLLALAFGLTASSADPFRARAIHDPPFPSLTYGIQAFLWWDETTAALRLDQIRLMVFSHVKQTIAWKDVEPIPGEWHFARGDWLLDEVERRGLSLVARLTDTPEWALPPGADPATFVDAPPARYADYARFCGAVAERYRGRIAAYQVWNEPNLAREWGGQTPDAGAFVELLRGCSDAIRAADPDAIIISAGLSPTGNHDATALPDDVFLQQMYDADFQRYVDVVGAHAPGYAPPERGPDDAERMGSRRFFTFRRVEDLRGVMVRNGDASRQMAILEMGWTRDHVNPAYSWFAVDEKTQARHLAAAYRYAAEHWRPWVGLMSAIYMPDPDWTPKDEEYHWSIILPKGSFLDAFVALANMPKFCDEAVLPPRAPDSPEALGLAPVRLCGE